jgi:hypothetical protein
MKCSSWDATLRSGSPNTNHEGSSFRSGRSPEGSTRASCVAGRCVTAILAARAAGTSAQNWLWKRSPVMYRSVMPSLRGTGCSASPSVLPGNMPASVNALSPGSGANAATYTRPTISPASASTFEIAAPP